MYAFIVGPTIASNLLLASLSIDRSMIVIHPTRYRLLITRCHVFKRISLVILIVVFIMFLPHFTLYHDSNSYIQVVCDLRPVVHQWESNLWPLMHTVLFALIPSLITCISSLILFHNRFCHHPVLKRTLSARSRRIQTLSLLIAIFSVGSLIAILPVCILEVLTLNDRIANPDSSCSMRRMQYKILLNYFLSLMSMNYSFKFYAHLIISTPFRSNFIRLLNCSNCHSHNKYLSTRLIRHRGPAAASPSTMITSLWKHMEHRESLIRLT
jgi:hypothetical protein